MKPGDVIQYQNQDPWLQGLGPFHVKYVQDGRIFFTEKKKGKLLSTAIEHAQSMFHVVGESDKLMYDRKEGF